MSSIACRDVSVAYGRRTVVRGFDETVGSGEWLGLIGPNGAGKSSLLKAIVGLVDHTGDVVVDGASLELRSRQRLQTFFINALMDQVAVWHPSRSRVPAVTRRASRVTR